MKYTVGQLREMGLPWKCTDVEIIDQSRWETFRRGVFEHNGSHYQLEWGLGSTPWDDLAEDDEIDCPEVVKTPVTVVKWVPVKDLQA